MKNRIVLLLLTLGIACGAPPVEVATPDPATQVPVTEPEAAESGTQLVILPFELHLTSRHTVDGETTEKVYVWSVNSDGELSFEGAVGARLTPEGSLLDSEGETLLSLMADGTVSGIDGDFEVRVESDGSISKDGEVVISFGTDGEISITGDTNPGRFRGPPEARRAAALVLMSMLLGGEAQESSEAESAPDSP